MKTYVTGKIVRALVKVECVQNVAIEVEIVKYG
jgi:hypothetical protein